MQWHIGTSPNNSPKSTYFWAASTTKSKTKRLEIGQIGQFSSCSPPKETFGPRYANRLVRNLCRLPARVGPGGSEHHPQCGWMVCGVWTGNTFFIVLLSKIYPWCLVSYVLNIPTYALPAYNHLHYLHYNHLHCIPYSLNYDRVERPITKHKLVTEHPPSAAAHLC